MLFGVCVSIGCIRETHTHICVYLQLCLYEMALLLPPLYRWETKYLKKDVITESGRIQTQAWLEPTGSLVSSNTGLKWAPGLSLQHQLLTDCQGVSSKHFPYRSPRCFNNISCTLISSSPVFAPPPPPLLGKYTSSISRAQPVISRAKQDRHSMCDCGANNQPAGKQSARR